MSNSYVEITLEDTSGSDVLNDKDKEELKVAKEILKYMNIGNLPRVLYDDRRLLIDSDKRTEEELVLAHFREDSLSGIRTARFIKDFYLYKAAPDLKTTNTSFLRTAEIFRKQGIKNYYFLLQLNNPMLAGVDPYDPNLTQEVKTMIFNECRENIWYFLREICKLNSTRKFMANRANISYIWNYLNHITVYSILPRQQGKPLENKALVRILPKGNNKRNPYWTTIDSIKIGDDILDRDGNVRQVTGVHPQGVKRLYNHIFSDGRSVRAGTEHLWTVLTHGKGLNGEPLMEDVETATLLKYIQQKRVVELPLVNPIGGPEIPEQDPYTVGKTLLDEGYDLGYQIGLPICFLETSVENKLALLNGLLDSEEHSKITSKGIELFVTNKKFNFQITYLVRSLGGTAKLNKNSILITLPEDLRYFRHRKLTNVELENLRLIENKLFLEKIVFSGDSEATCIEVNSEDELFITDDYILTHNTVSVQVVNFWLTYIMGRGYKSHLITLKSDNRAQFIQAIKTIRSSIPSYLTNVSYRDKDSGTSLTYMAFGEDNVNVLNVNVPQVGEAAAGDLGRGLTVGTTNIDEGSYINWIEAIINGCMPSALTEMANMRELGLPHGIGFITTPNTVRHSSGEYMYKRLMSATEWRESFFDSFSETHLRERLLKASPVETLSPSVSSVYNYLQLGKDKDWVKRTIDDLGLSISKAKIDLLLQWHADGENKVLDEITRDALINVKRNKLFSKEYKSGLFVDYFVKEETLREMQKSSYNDHFLIGVDTSAAVNKDACTVIIRSLRTGAVVGVGRYPLAFLDDVGEVLIDLLASFSNSILIPERNYAAHMIDNLLITLPAKGLDPFKKIYNTIYQDPIGNERLYEEVNNVKFVHRNRNFYLKFKQHFGFNTTASSRETLYNLLIEAVATTGYGCHYDKLIDELGLLEVRNDRIDHSTKSNDDLVIAWLLSYWLIKYGQNLSLYGINSGLSLTSTRNLLESSKYNKESSIQDPTMIKMLESLKAKLESLTNELLNTDDNILAMRIEHEIGKITKLLPPEARKITTIERIIEEANMERKKRRLSNKINSFAKAS